MSDSGWKAFKEGTSSFLSQPNPLKADLLQTT